MRSTLASAFLVLAAWFLPACTRPKPAPQAHSAATPGTVTVEVGGRPVDLAAGDLNEDGRLDLVCAVAGDRRISVNLQREYGWSASAPLPLPLEPHLVALADLDRDKHLDVVATAHDSGNVWAWLGDGTGRFAPADGSPFTAVVRERPHNHGLAIGDVDGDGDPDVVVTDQDGRSASVLLVDGRTLKTTPGSPIDLGGQCYPPALGDMDGDGLLDLVAPLVGGNAIAVLRGDGRGGFQHVPGSPWSTNLARPYAIALGDLDENKTLDVVVIHDDTDRITILLTSKDGQLNPAPGSPLALGRRVGTKVTLADMDRDGHLDLVAAGSGAAVVARGDGRGGFVPYWAEPAGEGWSAIVADFDGDSRLDLAVPDASADAVRIWLRVSP